MNVLLHTIALEPARWTDKKVSVDLVDLVPRIREAGFEKVEVYEPHLQFGQNLKDLKVVLADNNIIPSILSSYLDLTPSKSTDAEFRHSLESVIRLVARFNFKKVRLFPPWNVSPEEKADIDIFRTRLVQVANRLPGTQFLIETHDGSLADDIEIIPKILADLNHPNIGILFQPTYFNDREKTLQQLAVQKPFIKHIHLQNRAADLSFVPLKEGIVPWGEVLAKLPPEVDASLEFVPSGICDEADFNLERSLMEAKSEREFVLNLPGFHAGNVLLH